MRASILIDENFANFNSVGKLREQASVFSSIALCQLSPFPRKKDSTFVISMDKRTRCSTLLLNGAESKAATSFT
jgi:hypothetical protein